MRLTRHQFRFFPLIFIVPSLVLQASCYTKGIGRLSSSERAILELPVEVKEILVGIFLWDSHIVLISSTANSRLVYVQTSVTHKIYFY